MYDASGHSKHTRYIVCKVMQNGMKEKNESENKTSWFDGIWVAFRLFDWVVSMWEHQKLSAARPR